MAVQLQHNNSSSSSIQEVQGKAERRFKMLSMAWRLVLVLHQSSLVDFRCLLQLEEEITILMRVRRFVSYKSEVQREALKMLSSP